MPFLRRRGIMASEADIRRRTISEHSLNRTSLTTSGSSTRSLPPVPQTPTAALESHSNGFPEHNENHGDNANDTNPTTSSVAALSAAESNLSTSSRHVTPDSPQIDRPPSSPIMEKTQKHRRFSMLRFRNASDSQLSARAKRQAQAEKPPPVPKRASIHWVILGGHPYPCRKVI